MLRFGIKNRKNSAALSFYEKIHNASGCGNVIQLKVLLFCQCESFKIARSLQPILLYNETHFELNTEYIYTLTLEGIFQVAIFLMEKSTNFIFKKKTNKLAI